MQTGGRHIKAVVMGVVFFAAAALLPAHAGAGDDKSSFRFGTDPVVASVKPASPVSIKLKRLKDGTYTWELEGDDVEEVLRVDKILKRVLKTDKQ